MLSTVSLHCRPLISETQLDGSTSGTTHCRWIDAQRSLYRIVMLFEPRSASP
jgi:hypothetical protein